MICTFFYACSFNFDLKLYESNALQGGNKGIGKEIARRIGKEPNFTVLIACRDCKNNINNMMRTKKNAMSSYCQYHQILQIQHQLKQLQIGSRMNTTVFSTYQLIMQLYVSTLQPSTTKQTIQHSKIKPILQLIQTTLVQ